MRMPAEKNKYKNNETAACLWKTKGSHIQASRSLSKICSRFNTTSLAQGFTRYDVILPASAT